MPTINLKKNIIMSGGFRVVVMLLSFLISWITARYLGVELKGKLSYIITLGGFIWLVMDFGLYRSYPYLIRKHPDKTGSMYAWTIISFTVETIVFLALGLGFISFWNGMLGYQFNPLIMGMFIVFMTMTKAFMQLQGLYMGMDKIFDNSVAYLMNSAICLLILIAAYFLLKNTDRIAIVLCATLISLAFCLVYLVYRNKWGNLLRNFAPSFIIHSYSFGFRVFLSSLFIMFLLRADVIIVRRLLGFSDVGIYSLAAHIVDLLQVASNMVGGLLLVKLSDTESEVAKWVMMKKMLMVFFVLLSAANIGFVVCGRFILATMFGVQFVPVYYTYLWLIPASYGLSFGSLFNNYLNSKGFPIISIILPAIALGLNIILNLLFIPVMKIYGSALATSIAYLFWFVTIIIYEQKLTKGRMLAHLVPGKQDWQELWNLSVGYLTLGKDRIKRVR
ncbi:MAG: oligosaccharide flippase family protein [Candidatus Cloacimonas sp.]|jgi:O-antigen/teichoic acid export membrane protein|nr:oligosaccharide flippase family protein [Candidatus Cloacimonas sp.]